MTETEIARTVNVYRYRDVWCYALWTDGEYDTSDTLDISDDASEQDALDAARAMFAGARIERVADL